MRSPRFIVTLLLLLAAAIGGYQLFVARSQPGSGAPAGGKAKAAPPVPVRVAGVERRDLPVTLSLVGRAEAYESVTLRPRTEGQVVEVAFSEGQPVEAGALLVRLEAAEYEAKLRQAEAELARDRAQLARAQADLERYTTAKSYVSGEKLAEVRANADAAAATVRADEQAVNLARLQLGYTEIRAPFAGRTGQRLVSPGALVKANDTPLTELRRLRPIQVGFAVPERHLPRLREGLAGAEGLPVAVSVPGGAGTPLAGRAVRLDNTVDPASGTINVKALLGNEEERLTPGQFVQVELTLDTLRGAAVVPAAAVQQGPKGSFVLVVRGDATVEQRPVELRHATGELAAVTDLEAGERVVIDGHLRLTPGAKVQVK